MKHLLILFAAFMISSFAEAESCTVSGQIEEVISIQDVSDIYNELGIDTKDLRKITLLIRATRLEAGERTNCGWILDAKTHQVEMSVHLQTAKEMYEHKGQQKIFSVNRNNKMIPNQWLWRIAVSTVATYERGGQKTGK